MILKNHLKLYHGSYTKVEIPDLSMCRREKDFGRGFYLTTDRQQAEKFVKSSVDKAISAWNVPEGTHRGFVSEFEFVYKEEQVKAYEFPKADQEWLRCIVSHRKPALMPEELRKWADYDILIGKIANDNTNPTILAYMNRLFGDVDSETAMNTAINLLLPYRLKNQLCFRTQKALDMLAYTGCEEVTWRIK